MVADGIVDTIDPSTIRGILRDVDLQPHRTRYWKTSRVDASFKDRAEKVLWCYGSALRLAEAGKWVIAVDEIPNFQVLERTPIRRAIIGSIEQQEFEYTRHGTANLLLFLVVHTGRMQIVIENGKNAQQYIRALKTFRRRHRHLRGAFLIQDGDPSHTAAATGEYWRHCDRWWRPRFTPPHASWLNQAELLIRAFSRRYLKRTSWTSHAALFEHLSAAESEYNANYAHPFEWTWTNQKLRKWYKLHCHGDRA